MTRRNFAIWFAIFSLLQWPVAYSFYSFIDLILSMVIMAVMFSNIFGIALVCMILGWKGRELWLYFHDKSLWVKDYASEFVTEGVGFDISFWTYDLLPLVLALVILLHHYFCYKRCKDMGISAWWCLVPLYNPIMLLYKKSKADSEETIQN